MTLFIFVETKISLCNHQLVFLVPGSIPVSGVSLVYARLVLAFLVYARLFHRAVNSVIFFLLTNFCA